MHNKSIRTSVTPGGTFRYGVHRPAFTVSNQRQGDSLAALGHCDDGTSYDNHLNFPAAEVTEPAADWIYEIANPLPFRGATFIPKSWAETKVEHPERIALEQQAQASMNQVLDKWLGPGLDPERRAALFTDLPAPVRLALAANSTDPEDLIVLASQSCALLFDPASSGPVGLGYRKDSAGRARAIIHDHTLFEVVVNNPFLPDAFKEVMVLRPGAQGASEIVGEWRSGESHVFEYLRRNSYIPWGHYAANMANDAIRYRMEEVSLLDLTGLRHLYYQRTFCRLAADLGLALPAPRCLIDPEELEDLRLRIVAKIAKTGTDTLPFSATLWGWNYGFDCSANGYRLHASHQMVHQQFAMVPRAIEACHSGGKENAGAETFQPYGCGDQIHELITGYADRTGSSFFNDYLTAIRTNTRLDGRPELENSLIVHADERVILFVPKAQISQWELQLMTIQPVGNILEADPATRASLDLGIFTALRTLSALGARMITSIEYPKRFGVASDQRLLYSFLPKLPYAPGAFSEAQLRFICGHYPEDFARACRMKLAVYR
jgi:hypothetical protein